MMIYSFSFFVGVLKRPGSAPESTSKHHHRMTVIIMMMIIDGAT